MPGKVLPDPRAIRRARLIQQAQDPRRLRRHSVTASGLVSWVRGRAANIEECIPSNERLTEQQAGSRCAHLPTIGDVVGVD
jgi:hypothetical protein